MSTHTCLVSEFKVGCVSYFERRAISIQPMAQLKWEGEKLLLALPGVDLRMTDKNDERSIS